MRFLRILLAIVFISAGLMCSIPPTMAQETTATSTLSGLVVDIGTTGEASFKDPYPTPHNKWGYLQEDFLILLDEGEINIAFAQGDVNTESWFTETHENMANVYDSYSVLDEDLRAEDGWAMSRETYWLHFELVTYFEFYYHDVGDISLGVTVHATENNIVEYVEWAQQNILIGDDPVAFLAEIDHLNSLVDGTSGNEPRVVSPAKATIDDWKAHGLISESEWISPNYGTPVSWDENLWQVPLSRYNAIVTDDTLIEDVLTLVTTDRSGQAYIYASQNPSGFTPADWDAWWQSDAFLASQESELDGSVTLVDHMYTDSNASVILHTTDRFGYSYIMIIDTYLADTGNNVMVALIASPEAIADAYTGYWDGVMAYGDYYPLAWTPEEIAALQWD